MKKTWLILAAFVMLIQPSLLKAAETLVSVDFLRQKAVLVPHWGWGNQDNILQLEFKVSNKGPWHVAGLRYSTDGWKTSQRIEAQFVRFDGNAEIWSAEAWVTDVYSAPGLTFEYVIIVEDLLAANDIKQVVYNNGGKGCRILAIQNGNWTTSPNVFLNNTMQAVIPKEPPLPTDRLQKIP
ncbi:MAG: hypothetical protein KA248_05720 [Kiritimatiellae bacterium]|nr:hypothetical protein [Kiritimatiellia bacterium]